MEAWVPMQCCYMQMEPLGDRLLIKPEESKQVCCICPVLIRINHQNILLGQIVMKAAGRGRV
jgi:co-chaperonin GroES (HSP10)